MGSAATKDKAKTPDTSGNENGKEEKEPTLVEQIVSAVKEDNVRIVDLATGKDATDGPAHLVSLTKKAIAVGRSAKSAFDTFTKRTGLLADALIEMRQSIILPTTGNPDWGGNSAVYKKAAGLVIDAAMGEGETRATVANRIQRRVARNMGVAVALYVNETQGLKISEDEVKRVVGLKEKALEGDTGKNEKIQKLVSHVNSHYRVGTERPSNAPTSPFEAVPSGGRGTSGTAEEPGKVATRTLEQFRTGVMPHLAQDMITLELLRIAQKEWEILHQKENAAFGDGGREAASQNLLHAGAIFLAAGKELRDAQPTKAEREAVETALAVE